VALPAVADWWLSGACVLDRYGELPHPINASTSQHADTSGIMRG
jgi:hypothetical protein